MKPLQFENLKKLIEDGAFGTYRMFSVPGNELVASSGMSEDDKPVKMSTGDLIANVESRLDALGSGDYRIHLKKTPQSQASTEMIYRFKYVDDNDSAAAQPKASAQPAFYGLGSPDKLEDLIERRVAHALTVEREKNEIRDQMKELLFKMKELETARRRRPAKKELGFLNGIIDIAKIGAVTFISERYPKSIPLVEQTLKSMAGAEEEEEEEEETGFNVPAE